MGNGVSSAQVAACDRALKAGEGSASLHLSRAGLKAVPSAAFEAAHLQRLDLSDNVLSELPPELGNLTALKQLYVRDNKLAAVPTQVQMFS